MMKESSEILIFQKYQAIIKRIVNGVSLSREGYVMEFQQNKKSSLKLICFLNCNILIYTNI